MPDLGFWAHLLALGAIDCEQIACARFRASLRRFVRDHDFGQGASEQR